MSFEDAWAAARSGAAAKVSIQLNSVPTDSGGSVPPGKRLVVTSGLLNERANKADLVREDFVKADNSTMKETDQVSSSLKGFKSASAFSVFATRWRGQMKYVEGLLQNGVAGALRATAQDFAAREAKEKARHSEKQDDLK
ncbi:hypothetical protein SGFS_038190 [Streptomyces graminofaciens]|uniref:Uncharacterized protein n=1 Tax=Streptomyces graminofaciens TaxID=68212 RepID=A0ABM7F976_9ACTN|nr:hypothetical protein [Streptomyces graminofaciens]BBC32525.1 hypothetical protein SGFS_038190 [Streptomyces graminofaciens]